MACHLFEWNSSTGVSCQLVALTTDRWDTQMYEMYVCQATYKNVTLTQAPQRSVQKPTHYVECPALEASLLQTYSQADF